MPLPTDRSNTDPADTPAEHDADHNTLHAMYNSPRVLDHYYHVGTTPFERWYTAPAMAISNALGTGAPTIGVLRAMPFVSTRGGTIDRVGAQVTALAAAGVATIAIYQATSDTNLYPAALVLDCGEISTATTGMKTLTISQALTPNKLYWFVYWAGTLAATIRCSTIAHIMPVLGTDNALGAAPGLGIQATLAYAATCPNPFPAGGTIFTTVPVPVVGIRFSA